MYRDHNSEQPSLSFKAPSRHQTSLAEDIQHRVGMLEGNLRSLLNNQHELAGLVELLDALPLVKKTEQTVKSLQNTLSETTKACQKLEQEFSLSVSGIMGTPNNFVERNLKTVNNSIAQLRNTNRSLETKLRECINYRESFTNDEEDLLLRSVSEKVAASKKDMQRSLRQCVSEAVASENKPIHQVMSKHIESTVSKYQHSIKKAYRFLGSLRCELEFMQIFSMPRCIHEWLYFFNVGDSHDKRRQQAIAQMYSQMASQRQSQNNQEHSLLVGAAEEAVFLQQLTDLHMKTRKQMDQKVSSLSKRYETIKNIFNSKELEAGELEVAELQVAYLEDRWHSLKQDISGLRKKYLVQMRKLEDKLMDVMTLGKQLKDRDTEHITREYASRLSRLDQSVKQHASDLGRSEQQLDRCSRQVQDRMSSKAT